MAQDICWASTACHWAHPPPFDEYSLCRAWQHFGNCSRGNSCQWVHMPTWEQGQKWSSPRFRPTDNGHAELIQRVKALQRREGGYELWQAFCERQGGGKRDPAARDAAELEQFLAEAEPDAGGGRALAAGAGPSEQQKLAMQVKQGQRNSDAFKEAWWKHCRDFGSDVHDPTKHTEEFLWGFLAVAPQVPLPEDSEEHAALVAQVKRGQRASDDFKQSWYAYCRVQGTEKFDPLRHDSAFIQAFLDQVEVPEGDVARRNRYRPY
mmetsp:Transcript_119562/g.386004  ORF Transcript_119562/g.386004 Transcript_119562/m.386004 type:complete len:264 (+) Transcript_119562:93-884(+)